MRSLSRFTGLSSNAAVGGADSEWAALYSPSVNSKKLGYRRIVTSCRAVVLPRFGGPEVLELRDDASVPDLKPNEVLVRARAVSVNPLDTRVIRPQGPVMYKLVHVCWVDWKMLPRQLFIYTPVVGGGLIPPSFGKKFGRLMLC